MLLSLSGWSLSLSACSALCAALFSLLLSLCCSLFCSLSLLLSLLLLSLLSLSLLLFSWLQASSLFLLCRVSGLSFSLLCFFCCQAVLSPAHSRTLSDPSSLRALLSRRQLRERDMLSLPARMGGMGIFKPTEECLISSTNSQYISAPLVRLIERQQYDFNPRELAEEMKILRAEVDKESDARYKTKRDQVLQLAPAEFKLAVKAASEKGASSWVTACPSFDHGTVFHKGDFADACYLRYGWTLPNLPTTCACGTAFNVQHALDCRLGGLRIIQHNEVRDTIAVHARSRPHRSGSGASAAAARGRDFRVQVSQQTRRSSQRHQVLRVLEKHATGVFRRQGGFTFCQKQC